MTPVLSKPRGHLQCFQRPEYICNRLANAPSHSQRNVHVCGYADHFEEPAPSDPKAPSTVPVEPRDDDVLPDNLIDSLGQAADATHEAIQRSLPRCSVEILLPEFWDPMSGPVFSEEGDQMRFWKLCKRFSDTLVGLTGSKNVTVIYPDIGVASYLKNAWKDIDACFAVTSLNDRVPVSGKEDLVIIAAPDPQGGEDCVRVTKMVPLDVPVVLFNPRLVSGDVGIGLNVRRLRTQFLAQFITTYSIRPIDDIGTIYRRYPALWRVFIEDESTPGRYKLIAERAERPAGDGLDYILMEAMGGGGEEGEGPGLLQSLAGTMNSVQRFMKSLSN